MQYLEVRLASKYLPFVNARSWPKPEPVASQLQAHTMRGFATVQLKPTPGPFIVFGIVFSKALAPFNPNAVKPTSMDRKYRG